MTVTPETRLGESMRVKQLLDDDGPFAQQIKGFKVRESQQVLASKIAEAISEKTVLLAEAGTGTGKTLAYLVPHILAGKKTLISTGTKNLQEQLFFRDLPVALNALGRHPNVALLKGRANYLCLHRLDLNANGGLFNSREASAEFNRIDLWSNKTKDGDLAELDDIDERSKVWPMVTSTSDNCLGQDCPKISDCFVLKARRKAQNADIVVVNHHLFFADLALRDDGFGELLPTVEAVVLDEAHQIPEIASLFFGRSLSFHQIRELARDIEVEYENTAIDTAQLLRTAERLDSRSKSLRLSFGPALRRQAWSDIRHSKELLAAMQALLQDLAFATELLAEVSSRSLGLESCHNRATQFLSFLTSYLEDDAQSSGSNIRWFETFKHAFVLHETPIDIAKCAQNFLGDPSKSWLLCSATIAIGRELSHFADGLGIKRYESLCLPSPFDYQNQALLYVPRGLPDTTHLDFTGDFIDKLVPLITELGGRSFILFTSHRAMQLAAKKCEELKTFEILVQGSGSKSRLLEKFRRSKRGVLLGTSSFWEGVDIRGEQLSLVAIDKLPFGSPSDPILRARMQELKSRGQDAFAALQLPQAIISLKQGVGRLIRDVQDKGVLVLGDLRVVSKDYGQAFLSSLPDMARTRDETKVMDFLRALEPATESENLLQRVNL